MIQSSFFLNFIVTNPEAAATTTASVTNLENMFYQCDSLQNISDLKLLDVKEIKNLSDENFKEHELAELKRKARNLDVEAEDESLFDDALNQ